MPGWGLSVAISTLVGQSLGARRPELAEASLTLMGAVGVVFALFGRSIAGILAARPRC